MLATALLPADGGRTYCAEGGREPGREGLRDDDFEFAGVACATACEASDSSHSLGMAVRRASDCLFVDIIMPCDMGRLGESPPHPIGMSASPLPGSSAPS